MKIATAEHVDFTDLCDFVRPRHKGILATVRQDGRPQLSPVTMGMDAQDRVLVSTYPERAKVKNLRREPQASLCVLSDEFNGPWVQLDATAEVLDLPEALEPLVEYYRVIAGEHDDWEEYRAAMQRQGKCLVRLQVDRWGPIATGGFPPRLSEGT